MSESRSPFRKITQRNQVILAFLLGSVLFLATLTPVLGQETTPFQLVEATIEDIHDAIKSNQITCQELVQQYIRRAKAYNGVCTQLITEDGASIAPARGVVSSGAPLEFPTETLAVSSLLPDFDEYVGTPLDFGRMEDRKSVV